MRKRILALSLIMLLLAGATSASASAGSASDPLVSLSYAKSWAEGLLNDALPGIDSVLRPFYEQASAAARASLSTAGGGTRLSVGAGGSFTATTGASITLLEGAATVALNSGSLVNVSVGAEARNGKLNPKQLYLVCESAKVTVTASADAVFLVDGDYDAPLGKLVFADVPADAWYAGYVYRAVELGLVDGVSDTAYRPDGEFTVAQALKVAACMHQLYGSGAVTLENGEPWYASYVDYAIENGVAEARYATLTSEEYNAPISRREYVHLFYNALPHSAYAQINSVADDAIPDVKLADAFAAEIYAFYRAGILDGTLEDGSFLPDTNIKRSAVAAIIARMFDDSERKPITLP